MTRVYLTEQGSTGHKRGGRLEVTQEGRVLATAPLAQVEQVVVVGKGVQLSTALLVDLMSRGVEVAYVSRGGRFYGKAAAGPGGAVTLRTAQYAALGTRAGAERFARAVVAQKLAAQAAHLRAYSQAAKAAEAVRLLALTKLPAAENVDAIRGYEGAAAAAYWGALAAVAAPEWGFTNRRHYPAPDPLNAAFSFGYTLLLGEIVAAINLVGMDPYLGALHTPDPSRPSFALDIEEPFRPLGVDLWVMAAARAGRLVPAHFHRDGERSLLTPAGRRLFLELYERAMGRRVRHPLAPGRVTVRQAIELHVRLAGQVFGGGRPEWEGMEWL